MAETNEELVLGLIRDGYLKSPLLIEAFGKIDRKDFVPSALWSEAYGNYPLPIGESQTISQPLTVAFMLELLDPQPGEKILDVGSGSGWTTALLAYVVSKAQSAKRESQNDKCYATSDKQGLVVAVERVPELCKIGEENMHKYDFIERGTVKLFCGDASKGVPKELLPRGGPALLARQSLGVGGSVVEGFDKILAGAAAQAKIPEAWKKQLKIGGRIVAPVGPSIIVLDKISKNEFREREHFGFSFVPLVEETKER